MDTNTSSVMAQAQAMQVQLAAMASLAAAPSNSTLVNFLLDEAQQELNSLANLADGVGLNVNVTA